MRVANEGASAGLGKGYSEHIGLLSRHSRPSTSIYNNNNIKYLYILTYRNSLIRMSGL